MRECAHSKQPLHRQHILHQTAAMPTRRDTESGNQRQKNRFFGLGGRFEDADFWM